MSRRGTHRTFLSIVAAMLPTGVAGLQVPASARFLGAADMQAPAAGRFLRAARLLAPAAFLPVAAALLLGGCGRPFVDVTSPTIEVISPDPGLVQEAAEVTLRLRASSFRDVDRVEIGGQPFEQTGQNEWSKAIVFRPGVNRLVIEAFDAENVAGVDTINYLFLDERPLTSSWEWPEARAGHTATRDGLARILLIGGASSIDGPVSDRIDLVLPGTQRVVQSESVLSHARIGHTSSLLPDGRILVAGGASSPTPSNVAQLIEPPEIFDPVSGSVTTLTVVGAPIRRAFHTAQVRSTELGTVIDLLGGLGDTQYVPVPDFGYREDIRTFLLTGDTLEALSPPIGPFIDLLAGHTQTALARQTTGTPTRQLVSGTIFEGDRSATFHFVMDPRSPLGFMFDDLPAPATLRQYHAAVLIGPGRALLMGGLTAKARVPSGSGELYEDTIGTFFGFSPSGRFIAQPRYLHSATNLGDDRILVTGGFSEIGTAVTTVDILDFSQ